MKKGIYFISGLFSFLLFQLFYITPAYAVDTINFCPENSGNPFAKLCGLGTANFSSFVGGLITLLLIIAVVIAVIFLVIGGIRWIVSGGDKQGVESARNMLVAAIVGLVIALLAFFILRIVLGLFGINESQFNLPNLIK
ncbi:MAG: hypothetical protein M1450_04705 [Patescibacteria group bacterium]|nr:hypothetical protein [Patescibacteria group bacterium]